MYQFTIAGIEYSYPTVSQALQVAYEFFKAGHTPIIIRHDDFGPVVIFI